MNILLVADVSMQKVIGGAERVLREESVRLQRRGHQVYVLTRRLPGQAPQDIIQGVQEFRYDVDESDPLRYFMSSTIRSRRLFHRLVRCIPFHVINFHQPFSAFGVHLSRWSKFIKKAYTFHSVTFREYETRAPQPRDIWERTLFRLNVLGRRLIEGYSLRRCQMIRVLSPFSMEQLIECYHLGGRDVRIIPGGVDVERFRPVENRIAVRREFGIPAHRFVLFTVRNLVPRMGLELLIEAMAQVRERASDVLLVMGGEGPLREQLEDLIRRFGLEEEVRLIGFVPEEDLPRYYAMADVFVLPTRMLEGFGLVTLEALASGTPVLGTPVGATEEILGGLDRGMLFEGRDSRSMADLIYEKYGLFKRDPEEYERWRTRCRAYVERNYSWGRSVDKLEGLFTEAVARDV